MRITLDTNILHQEGYNSQSMRLLQRAIIADHLDLIISQIVIREYETKRHYELQSKIQAVKINFKDINKIFSKAGQEAVSLNILNRQIEDLTPQLHTQMTTSTQNWLKDFKVTILDPDPAIYGQVWDDYFSGTGAFKKLKNREDIPDAVIGRSLERLVCDATPLIFICKDGQLREFVAKFPGVTLFSELSDFIQSDEFTAILQKLDAKDQAIDAFKFVIGSEAFLNNTIKYFSAKDSDFYYSYWEDGMIENLSNLPLPVSHGVSAGSPIISSIKNVTFGSVSCIDLQHYVVPVNFEAFLPISFVGEYIDWIHAEDEIKNSVEVISANADGACEFSLLKKSTVMGEIAVHLLVKEEPNNLLIHSQYIGTEESPLDIEFIPKKVIL